MKKFSETTRNNVIATIVAPIAVFPAMFLLYISFYLYSAVTSETITSTDLTKVSILVTVIGWVFAVVATLFYGLPVALILQYFNKFKVYYLIPLSLMPTAMIFAFTNTEVGVLFLYAYCSIIVSLTYWYSFNKRCNGI